ncbi:MAG: hypothetical protein KHX03_09540 [Clostridium sp.]|nr:hypothetical protein [Clostridium sp.]
MNISKISLMASPLKTNFKAQTNISAPEELLSKEDQAYFEALGSKIGTDKDTIEIKISELHDNKFNPNIKMYTAEKKYKIKHANGVSNIDNKMDIPYIKNGEMVEKNSPFNYIKTAFDRLLDK